MIKKYIIILIVLLLVACSQKGEVTERPVVAWPVSSPEDQGLDGVMLENVLTRLAAGNYGFVDRFLLVRNGYLVVDQGYEQDYGRVNAGKDTTPHQYNYHHTDWHPYYQGSELHTLQSVTKSVTSLAVGIAIQRGELPGTGVTVLDYFEEYDVENLDERWGRITLEDILTMRSGIYWDEWSYPADDPRNSVTQLEASQDWIQYVLDLPMVNEPGETFVYNSGGAQLLSVIIKSATGLHVDAYLEAHLFQPLGIQDYYWKKTPKGWPDTEGGLYLKAEDLAKIGYLVLKGGAWEGEQIVPEAWIAEMTSPKVPDVAPEDPDWNFGYGYLWWLVGDQARGEPQVYGALGYGGQFLLIVPELDLVGVFNGWNIYGVSSSQVVNLFIERIIPAAGDI